MIFSLLNIRKKTAAIISGIAIGAACLWGLSIWQDISGRELFNVLLATVFMLGSIMLAALTLIVLFKFLAKTIKRLKATDIEDDTQT